MEAVKSHINRSKLKSTFANTEPLYLQNTREVLLHETWVEDKVLKPNLTIAFLLAVATQSVFLSMTVLSRN